MKKNKILFYLLIFLLFLLSFVSLNNFIMDNYWNYGFSYNIANDLIPYRDFNMVLFPLFPLLCALVMKIFGSKLIIYYLFCSLIATLIIYFVKKLNGGRSITLAVIYFLLLFEVGGYNILTVLLFFILLYLEHYQKSDYLIGLILSFLLLTNQKMIVLLIPTIISCDYKKILKRLMTFLVPIQILLMYLFFNNALACFIDYTILGLFDFGHKNFIISLYFIIELLIIVYFIYKYLKTKDNLALYCLCFQIISIPIFDSYHLVLSLIPFSYYAFKNIDSVKIVNIMFIFFILLTNFAKGYYFLKDYRQLKINLDSSSNYFLTFSYKNLDSVSDTLYKYYCSYPDKTVYYFIGNSYYYKLSHKITIDKYDLLLYGNNGYNGNEKLINRLKQEKDAIAIVEDLDAREENAFDQFNFDFIHYVEDNYKRIDRIGIYFNIYEIKN